MGETDAVDACYVDRRWTPSSDQSVGQHMLSSLDLHTIYELSRIDVVVVFI